MTTSTTVSSSKGPPTDDNSIPESSSSNHSHDDEDDPFMFRSRKSYPQRVNRPRLNYRDLERGVYDRHEIRQSMWAMGGPSPLHKVSRPAKSHHDPIYSDDDDETMDLPAAAGAEDDDDDEEMIGEGKDKASDETDQMHRRLWCVCKKPWDHSRLMLRCDSCANWYHGDCIGVTKEQARMLDMKGDQFVCPPCQGNSQQKGTKPGRLSDESMMIKRKRIEAASPSDRKMGERYNHLVASKPISHSEPSKRPKTGIFFHRDAPAEPQIHCIVHGCSNWAKAGWVYCTPACIRRHINETLQAIQRSKGTENDNPPLREDILLYESRTKKVLERKLVPKVEDLCTWINQHPSYEIVKPALRQSILLTANESKSATNIAFARSTSTISSTSATSPRTPTTPNPVKPKLSWAPVGPISKPVPIKKAPVPLSKPSSQPVASSNAQNTADIRSKVPSALFDKLMTRIEKSGEKSVADDDDVRSVANKIEEEMFRVYGKVDNSYKNKFRSLLANISNMNNNFFYKQILSKEVTAKQIVAMKPEDMLPPEEKEKRKDDFEKEVQKIMEAEEQTAEEMARRAKIKVTRQGIVDNDSVFPVFQPKEEILTEEKESKPKEKSKTNTEPKAKIVKKTDNSTVAKPTAKAKKVTPSSAMEKPAVPVPTSDPEPKLTSDAPLAEVNKTIDDPPMTFKSPSPIPIETLPESEPPIEIRKPPVTVPVSQEESYSVVDLDNDYIEPESPTGIDALLYDDDDELNHTNSHSRSSSISQKQQPESPGDHPEYLSHIQQHQTMRDDYNPLTASKAKADSTTMYQPTPISRSTSGMQQWRGFINPPDVKIPCQSVWIYGDADYLIGDIPEQLGILGRLRLGDLWDYIRDSLAVRDVILLTLISASGSDTSVFTRYVDSMRTSGRAAVINKRTDPSIIRDMYILAADTKECSANVLTALSLPTNIDPKQLLLVIIGSGKKSTKSTNRPNGSPSVNNLTYNPVPLKDAATAVRDPRLLRNKDPRLAATASTDTTSNNPSSVSTVQPTKTDKPSIDQSLKLIADSLDRIRHASSAEEIQSIVTVTVESLQSNGHEELCARFSNEMPTVISQWQTSEEKSSAKEAPTDDNLNEENMDVEEEMDDRYKKQLSTSEFNDVDYRFLDQDMDHRLSAPTATTTTDDHTQKKDLRKKSRFSDVPPAPTGRDADDRDVVPNSFFQDENNKRARGMDSDSDLRTTDVKRTATR